MLLKYQKSTPLVYIDKKYKIILILIILYITIIIIGWCRGWRNSLGKPQVNLITSEAEPDKLSPFSCSNLINILFIL